MKYFKGICALVCSLISAVVVAESELDFAKTTENPLSINPTARYFSIPIQNYTNFKYGPSKKTQDILYLKPVTPLRFTKTLDFIFRTYIPFAFQPTSSGDSYVNGIGDINPTAFVAPVHGRGLVWAFGPSLILPTASNSELGAGKWSLGPELVLVTMPSVWTVAILTNNFWSLAGQDDRPTVNQFNFQYFITYNLPHGWQITTQPNMTANWLKPTGERWTIPVGAGFGRAFHMGKQGIRLSLEGYYNVIRPSTSEQWTLKATIGFLFLDRVTDPNPSKDVGRAITNPI